MVGLPLLIVGILLIKNAQRKAWQALSRKQSNLNAYLHESLTGMKVTQSFAREEESLRIFRKLGNDYKSFWFRAVKVMFLISPIIDNISMISVVLIFFLGIAWLGHGVTIGILIAFLGYVGRFWEPITNLGNLYNSLVNA
jgi:ATP-binding cassette subfamily B protein